MKILLDVATRKAAFAMEFFKNVSFIKKAKAIAATHHLKGWAAWRVRINLEHRIVYKVESNRIVAHLLKGLINTKDLLPGFY